MTARGTACYNQPSLVHSKMKTISVLAVTAGAPSSSWSKATGSNSAPTAGTS